MSRTIETTREHVLELRLGEEGAIELRSGTDQASSFAVTLAAVDPAAGKAELRLEDMWDGYQMRQFMASAGRWMPIWPGENGDVRAVVGFGAGKHLNISSDLAVIHSLDLTDVIWQGGSLRLTFRESRVG